MQYLVLLEKPFHEKPDKWEKSNLKVVEKVK